MDDIPNKVKDLLTSHLEKIVYLKADQRAKYQVVEDVVDNLRAAGVDTLGLLTGVATGLSRRDSGHDGGSEPVTVP